MCVYERGQDTEDRKLKLKYVSCLYIANSETPVDLTRLLCTNMWYQYILNHHNEETLAVVLSVEEEKLQQGPKTTLLFHETEADLSK